VQSKGIFGSYVEQKQGIPGTWSRCGDKIQGSCRQRRHVQGLADMASRRLRPALMVMQERAAGREKEQYGAAKER
jgi:hypothetical protein